MLKNKQIKNSYLAVSQEIGRVYQIGCLEGLDQTDLDPIKQTLPRRRQTHRSLRKFDERDAEEDINFWKTYPSQHLAYHTKIPPIKIMKNESFNCIFQTKLKTILETTLIKRKQSLDIK